MGFLKTAFLLSIFWCQIQTAPVTEKACPNNSSYIFGDNCYSLHTDLLFTYDDADGYCKSQGGNLWSQTSEDEINFLRKLQAKQSFLYWIGAEEKGYNWKYLSDHSPVSVSLINAKKHKHNQCLTIKQNEHKMKALPCRHNLYTVCEYTDEICENRKDESKGCYEFTNTEEDFNTATITCENLGARIVEVRNELQLTELKEAIRQDKAFEDITDDKLNKHDGSFPILWYFKQRPEGENICQIYQDRGIQTTDCSGSRNFACKFHAIQKTKEFTVVNAHSTQITAENDDLPKEPGQDDVTNISTTTTTLIIIMVIMVVILIVAIAFLAYRLYWAGMRGHKGQGAESQSLTGGK